MYCFSARFPAAAKPAVSTPNSTATSYWITRSSRSTVPAMSRTSAAIASA